MTKLYSILYKLALEKRSIECLGRLVRLGCSRSPCGFGTPDLTSGQSLRILHLPPINAIIYGRPTRFNLEGGFPLICFQQLSCPTLATRRCSWWNNRYTRGSFAPVLSSSFSFISKGSDYIFTLSSNLRLN